MCVMGVWVCAGEGGGIREGKGGRYDSSLSLSYHRREFFNDLYHRFLLSPKPSMKAMCLQVSLPLL